jgi:3-hydroxyisobutyrate dehydrogenase
MLALGRAMGVEPGELAALFDHFNPGAQAPARFKRVLDADYANPSWELAMARKDARLMLAEVDRAGGALEFLPILAARMDRFLAEGQGHADWTVIARELVGERAARR